MTLVNPVYRIILVRTLQVSALAWPAHWLLHWPLTGPHALGLFLTPALCLYFVFVFVAPWSWGLPISTRLPTSEKLVALTFDDGPSPETTGRVLDILREHGARATFFVLGEAVRRSPELLRRIATEGHRIGIHAYRHQPFTLLSRRAIEDEICRTREMAAAACPEAEISRWLRPPHGFKSLRALWAARRLGCRLVTWTTDGRDYRERLPAQIAKNVLAKLRPGNIVLLHDGPRNAVTVEALPLILQELEEQGYQCVTLPVTVRSGLGGQQSHTL